MALSTGMIPASIGDGNECAYQDSSPEPPKVAAIINLFGITDVADLLQGPDLRAYAVSWLGSAPEHEELARRISPLTYVRPGLPPILTIHGDADKVVRLLPCSASARSTHQSRSSQSTAHHSRRRTRSIYGRPDELIFEPAELLKRFGIRSLPH